MKITKPIPMNNQEILEEIGQKAWRLSNYDIKLIQTCPPLNWSNSETFEKTFPFLKQLLSKANILLVETEFKGQTEKSIRQRFYAYSWTSQISGESLGWMALEGA